MVPMEGLSAEEDDGEEGEDDERDDLLDDFELHEGEGAAVALEAEAVGGHLGAVLEEGHAPRYEDDADEGPVADDFHFLEFQVAVPSEGHEDVRDDEEQYGVKSVHGVVFNNSHRLGWREGINLLLLLTGDGRTFPSPGNGHESEQD